MKYTIAFLVFCSLMFSSTFAGTPPTKTKKTAQLYVSHFENVLGTSLEIKTSTVSAKQAIEVENIVLNEITRLSSILSAYDANSEFSNWLKTKNQPITVSKDLFTVLSLFDQWRVQTAGALSASAETVNLVWKDAAAKNQLPANDALKNAIAQTQQIHWTLDAANKTATHISDAPLKLNSFAKSYIIKAAANAAMTATKINGILVNIGGDLVIAGNISENIQISNPKADAENDAPIDNLVLSNKAVATSGNYRRGELINGVWYSHIIDPRTALPANEIISATVVANSATDAGALATAFNVLSTKESIALAAKYAGVDYLIITKNGDRIESANWKNLVLAKTTATNINIQTNWKNEVLIGLELAQQPGFAKRPFAAVWVEDKDKKTVKTIALWYNKARWLPDVKEWFRKNGAPLASNPAAFSTITSATRSPGKYTLKWDGKDDQGTILKPGKYTIHIEVVREHGGYDLLHQEIDCNDTPQQFNLKGNIELVGASIEYKKKSAEN